MRRVRGVCRMDSIHPRRMPRWLKKEEELCKDVL